jgi:hypothetical protein
MPSCNEIYTPVESIVEEGIAKVDTLTDVDSNSEEDGEEDFKIIKKTLNWRSVMKRGYNKI